MMGDETDEWEESFPWRYVAVNKNHSQMNQTDPKINSQTTDVSSTHGSRGRRTMRVRIDDHRLSKSLTQCEPQGSINRTQRKGHVTCVALPPGNAGHQKR
jgi:hypothetical protein